ncbi:peroxisomal acyl-coenzyme A oxidase 1.2 [Physcia stellaris]|nr:peroxisomal acyl-coenzyme A oxidase 1.2 [Physcia stellaris]
MASMRILEDESLCNGLSKLLLLLDDAFEQGLNLVRVMAGNGRSNVTSTPATRDAVETRPLQSILIANRGEIALRVGKTASQYGIKTTTVYTNPDARSQHALSSPFAVNLGDVSAYLDGDKIIEVAKQNGCVGIHPGYGFLSENSVFARKCTDSGLVFIGPPWEAIEAMGNKSRSKIIMTQAGVPCIPGYHGNNQDADFLKSEASKIGFPVLLKAVKGGGGKGMRIAMTPEVFHDQLESAKSEARSSFGDDVMLVEKYITTPRHIEVQIFADKHGNCVALGERDCSIQRRHQKILEESPAPNLEEAVRQDLWAKARAAALAVGYEGAGTVEFIFDNDTGEFFFMEMNTRLQVEHPVTEMVTGEDLVRWQIIVAEGGKLPLSQQEVETRIAERGHAIEARIYAENPRMNFIPDSGKLTHMQTPQLTDTVRVDAGFVAGDEVSSHYDPMIAKLIVRGENREIAIHRLHAALNHREFRFVKGNSTGATDPEEVVVKVKSVAKGIFDIQIGDTDYVSTASHWDSRSKTITSYFPHTRLDTRFISEGGEITLFQQGQQYRLRCATPTWVEKALGLKDNAHSVLAPMPCKILRVQVEDLCKAGTALVEFELSESH